MSRPKTHGRPFTSGDKRINRAGRPLAADCLTDWLRIVAAESAGAGKTHVEKLARVLWRKAEAGDVRAAALIGDRTGGRPAQQVEVAPGPEDRPRSLVLVMMGKDGTERRVTVGGAAGEPHAVEPER